MDLDRQHLNIFPKTSDSQELREVDNAQITYQLQQALRESEQRFKALAEATPVPMVISRAADGEILFANDKLAQTFKLPNKQAIGQKMLDFYHNLADRRTLLAELSEQGVLDNYELQARRADGMPFWVKLSVRSLTFNNEPAILTTFHDITERKQATEAIRQQAEREKLVGAMRDRIRESLHLSDILNTTVTEVRQFLDTDRVVVFRFNSDLSGEVAVESVGEGWIEILRTTIYDPCFASRYIESYQQGRISAIEDVSTAKIDVCHLELLSQLQVRANLIVPIIFSSGSSQQVQAESATSEISYSGTPGPSCAVDFNSHSYCNLIDIAETKKPTDTTGQPQLWGLLIAHHCSGPREWQLWEKQLLEQLAGHVAIAIKQAQLYQQLQEANHQLRQLVSRDALTQVANRRRFDEYLQQEWQRSALAKTNLSLILADVDRFKAYNDTYGHLAGDLCLQQVAAAINCAIQRPADLVARYGGEEFAAILPDTDIQDAVRVARAIREGITRLKLAHAKSPVLYVTLSLGVASIVPTAQESPDKLVAAADKALYRAKNEGRDCIRVTSMEYGELG